MAWASEKAEIDAENQRLSKEIADLKARTPLIPAVRLLAGFVFLWSENREAYWRNNETR
jgi:hypothetical protein